MEASPYYKLIMNSINMKDRAHDYILALLIKKRMSYLHVENNPNFKADDFDLVLKLTRFHALSYGRNHLTYDDYEYVLYFTKRNDCQ